MKTPEKGHVLLVDDDETFLKYASKFLEESGLACDTSQKVEECLEKAGQQRYDALITDLVMPGNTDLNLVEALAQKAPGVPIIIITAYPTMDTAIRAVSLPVQEYLVKPFEPAQLLNAVQRVLGRQSLLKMFQTRREKLHDWIADVNAIEQSLSNAGSLKGILPLDTFVGLTFSNIVGALADLSHLVDALLNNSPDTSVCGLLNCPRLQAQQQMLRHAISILDKTKRSFKSKELGELRKALEQFLASA